MGSEVGVLVVKSCGTKGSFRADMLKLEASRRPFKTLTRLLTGPGKKAETFLLVQVQSRV